MTGGWTRFQGERTVVLAMPQAEKPTVVYPWDLRRGTDPVCGLELGRL